MEAIPAYSPRWLSRFFDWIDALPVPGWLITLSIVVLIPLAMHLAAWAQGALPQGEVHPYLAMQGAFIAIIPAAWRLLDRHAQRAMREFYAALGRKPAAYRTQLEAFLSLPVIPATILFVLGLQSGVQEVLADANTLAPISGEVLPWLRFISWPLSNAFMALIGYRILLQIGRINRLFDEIKLDIFSPGPVYILSRYGGACAATILVVGHGLVLLALPEYYFSPGGLFYLVFFSFVGLLIFFAPLTAINQRMRRAKEQLLDELGQDQKRINARLHAAIGKKDLPGISDLRTAVSTLREQREVLAKLPTWPWQPDALRSLLTPMLFPVLVYVAQRFLGSLLGF